MARRPQPDWIVACVGGAQGKCLRCGDVLNVELPVRIEVWLAASRAFVKAHSSCPPKESA